MTTPDWLERTSLLMGPDKMERFRRAHVLVVGTGGVGAYAAEMLVRAGIGRLTLLDADRVQPSNINRQLCALHSTVGEEKVRVLGLRFKDINPELDLTALYLLLLLLPCLASCHYPRPDLEDGELGMRTRDSLRYLYERHYTWDTNLELLDDSVTIACLPVKDCYNTLYRGDRVVVAEFAIHPADSVDSVWVKLAHSQEVQGWIREKDMMRAFVPTDSISQAIYLFSETHASYFIVIFALFVAVWLFRAFRRKQLQMVCFNDIDSVYPLLLCLLLAFSATVYESMQVFVPETWQHFYFNPTLSPFRVPLVLSVFLMSLWLFVIVLLAVLDDLFRLLSPAAAVFYLLGLASCCIFCYFFFILTTQIYIGYLFIAVFVCVFFRKLRSSLAASRYRCGNCGQKIGTKGVCPHCGAINE